MGDWERVMNILSSVETYSPADASLMPSMKVWKALQLKLAACFALSAAERDEKVSSARKEIIDLEMEKKKRAVTAVAEHFNVLLDNKGAVEDAMRPLPADSVFWVDPKLHEAIAQFLAALDDIESVTASEGEAVEWALSFKPEERVLDAKFSEAAAAYEQVKQAFDKICSARDVMRHLDEQTFPGKSQNMETRSDDIPR